MYFEDELMEKSTTFCEVCSRKGRVNSAQRACEHCKCDQLAPVLPFLKWPGGKRWAASTIASIIRRNLYGTYYEPFLGGGAVFFRLLPAQAEISDLNPDLINTYTMVKKQHKDLIKLVREMPVTKEYYLHMRSVIPDDNLMKAARFLYLNRTAFGGIYRLNQEGKFNVPFGGGQRTPAALWEKNLLSQAHQALSNTTIKTCDFREIFKIAKAGDVIYCDPAYTVAHDRNGFIRYNEKNFSWKDQEILADEAARACSLGVTVLISNAHHASLLNLYPTAVAHTLSRNSLLNPISINRREVQEYLFVLSPH